jgi:hypothetical protein
MALFALLVALAFANDAEAAEGREFNVLLHIKEGPVDGAVVGGKCLGESETGLIKTVGCARRRSTPLAAVIDAECWITVRSFDPAIIEAVLRTWGHELAHCAGYEHNDQGVWNANPHR